LLSHLSSLSLSNLLVDDLLSLCLSRQKISKTDSQISDL
jgi:hypothetical protein